MSTREVVVSARTIEEARLEAILKLGESPERVHVEVITEGKPGFFGIGAKPAQVRAWLLPERSDFVEGFVTDVLRAAGADAEVTVKNRASRIQVDIQGNVNWLIGPRGEALEALQYLTNVSASRAEERGELAGDERVVMDIGGHRRRRHEELTKMAVLVADKVRASGVAAKLEPMPASERRIIHMALQKDPEIRTRSQGQEPRRQVVVEKRQPGEPVPAATVIEDEE